VKCHEKSNLVILCPEHHHRANCGEISKEKIVKYKNTPHNKDANSINKDISLNLYEQLDKIKIGNFIYSNVPILLEIDGKTIISITKDVEGFSLLNALFYDSDNTLLAEVKNNEWYAYLNNLFWDIRYSPGHLVINNMKNKILIELKTLNNCIELRCILFYNGYKYEASPNSTRLNSNKVFSGTFTISNCQKAIVINTSHM
jgi:hypothetical protein